MGGNIFIIIGIAIIFLGLMMSGRLGAFGKLPGDIAVTCPGFSFYFPLATSLIVSIVISLILWFVRR